MSTIPRADAPAPARFRSFAGYVAAAALCVGLLTWILELWRRDLSAPFTLRK